MGLVNFYKCEECNTVMLEMGSPAEVCKNAKMELLKPNADQSLAEKHIPIVTMENNMVHIKVGRTTHPSTAEHDIEWIYVKTTFGGLYANLEPTDPPEASFMLRMDEVEEVYAYCNLHGLWKATELDLPNGFTENNVACSPEFANGCVNSLE